MAEELSANMAEPVHDHDEEIFSENDTAFLSRIIGIGNIPSPEIDDFMYATDPFYWYATNRNLLCAKFFKSFSNDETGNSLLQGFITNTQDLLQFKYQESPDTIRMLFVSGCTILQFIHSFLLNELEELLDIGTSEARNIQELLFNFRYHQIPFRVIELLVNMSKDPDQLKKDVVKFIYINNIITRDLPSDDSLLKQWDDITKSTKHPNHVHLLQLLYLLVTSGNVISTNNNNKNEDKVGKIPGSSVFSCFCRKRPISMDPRGFFRTVEELKSTGIEFKPSRSCLATISFSSKCFNLKGHLKLPPLIVDRWTEGKLDNLLLYEKFINENIILSYIKFMDILIDIEQDVKQLRASRVLQNRLSSDADVANLFNKLGSKFSDPQHDYYRHVKMKIQKHCERKCAIWMTQFYHKYFSNPWAIIGLMAAVIVLSLTAVQAWFAVNPRK